MITSVVRAFFHSGLRNAGHAVRDRLDAGDGRAARRERLQHEEQRRAQEQPVDPALPKCIIPASC